jgi:hypothetical protein
MNRDDLGEPRRLADDPALCSKCGAELTAGDVPLLLFGDTRADGDCDAWQYCRACEGAILTGLMNGGHMIRDPLALVRPNQEPD